ncbi:MAG: DUF4198 domain-containing protein [Gemmatimonas sp.]
MAAPTRTSPLPRRHKRSLVTGAGVVATLTLVSTAAAHDTWLIPDLFSFATGATIHVNARAGGGKFPAGSPVQLSRVADARIIGASGETKISEMAVENGSLRLHQKPQSAGQYLIVMSLTPGTMRSTPAGLIRFLRAEGGAAEAARLERENTLSGADSVVFTHAGYAATVVQVGRGGARGFSRSAGLPLEFVPLNDPALVRIGDTLHVRVLGAGKPVAGIGVDFKPAADTTPNGAPAPVYTTTMADANGVVHLPLTVAGPWLMRSAFVSPRAGGVPNEYSVSRSTYVWNVSSGNVPPARTDSADAVAAVQRFTAALATGDSARAASLLAQDVLIVESGTVETRQQYLSHHLGADMKASAASKGVRTVIKATVAGDAAYVVSRTVKPPTGGDASTGSESAELMVLSRMESGWTIRAIHWSSRRRRS